MVIDADKSQENEMEEKNMDMVCKVVSKTNGEKTRKPSDIPRYLELLCDYGGKRALIESAVRATHPGYDVSMQPHDFEHTTVYLGDEIDARKVAELLKLEQPEWDGKVRVYEKRY